MSLAPSNLGDLSLQNSFNVQENSSDLFINTIKDNLSKLMTTSSSKQIKEFLKNGGQLEFQ